MKAIFLDLDGVVNSARSALAQIGSSKALSQFERELGEDRSSWSVGNLFLTVDPVSIALLNMLIEHVQLVVLSSSHRAQMFDRNNKHFGSEHHLADLKLMLTHLGLNLAAKKFAITDNGAGTRAEQILRFIATTPDIEEFVVLDDMNFSDTLIADNSVLVQNELGFNIDNLQEAAKILSVKLSRITESGLIV